MLRETDVCVATSLNRLGPLGFKCLEIGEGVIRSAVVPFVWDGPIVRMNPCESCKSPVPNEGCVCGFHACYSAGQVIDQYASLRDRIVVLVEGQGKVIPHERGWRAEQCVVRAVVELYSGNMIKHLMNTRARKYFCGAPIVSLEDAMQVIHDQCKFGTRGSNGYWQAD
jgi:hypothetical protein